MSKNQGFYLDLLKFYLDREHREYRSIFPMFPYVLLSEDQLFIVGKVEVTELQLFMIESFCEYYGIEIVFFP